MKQILVLGAGRSASSLIKYLLDNTSRFGWYVTVGDVSVEAAMQKTSGHPGGKAITFDVYNEQQRTHGIKEADLVISLLPAHMHYLVAVDCVRMKKHMVTASYVSKEIKKLDEDARTNGVLLLNEIGLDPGIDHLSAMKIIDTIKAQGGDVVSFKSYCGGLIAPESNDNPWGYKFTWNPRNVVLAGQGTAQYIEHGKHKYVPYNRLFRNTETITIDGYGKFEAYPNRDSLVYREAYGLDAIPTLLRGTLRTKGFCRAWDVFVKLGLTDDSYIINNSESISYVDLIEAFLPSDNTNMDIRSRLASFIEEPENSEVMKKLDWLGVFENRKTGLYAATPAQILQQLLEEKWKLHERDIDMIVMQHQFEYIQKGKERKRIVSSLVVKGDDAVHTAMAKTVGLPVGIAAKLILNRTIKLDGVRIPVMKEIYEPVLNELATYGIVFKDVYDS